MGEGDRRVDVFVGAFDARIVHTHDGPHDALAVMGGLMPVYPPGDSVYVVPDGRLRML